MNRMDYFVLHNSCRFLELYSYHVDEFYVYVQVYLFTCIFIYTYMYTYR